MDRKNLLRFSLVFRTKVYSTTDCVAGLRDLSFFWELFAIAP